MATEQHFDVVILGSGQAGNSLLGFFASSGKSVALVEREMIGGACPNVACLPSKSLIHSAKTLQQVKLAQKTGLCKLEVEKIDFGVAIERKRLMVQTIWDRHVAAFAKSGAVTFLGQGCFLGPKTLEVRSKEGTRIVTGDTMIINLGTTARLPDVPGLLASSPLTHVGAFELYEVPGHLLILGGGYVGIEFAHMMKRFGAQVSVVEHNDRILKHEDADVSAAVMDMLQVEGIQFHLSANVTMVDGQSGKHLTLTLLKDGGQTSITGTHLLCATGRVPNTSNIGLAESGIKLDGNGYILVDDHLQTNIKGVFAVAECAGSPHFTHVSIDDGRVVQNLFLHVKMEKTAAKRLVPSTLFTSPELAHVGARENELKAQGIDYRLGKVSAGSLLRNLATGETEGFLKVMVAANTDDIFGFTALSAQSGEMLLPIQLAMQHGIPYTDIMDTMICHPTYSEGLLALFATVPPRK